MTPLFQLKYTHIIFESDQVIIQPKDFICFLWPYSLQNAKCQRADPDFTDFTLLRFQGGEEEK